MPSDSENTSNRSVTRTSVSGITGPYSSSDSDEDSGSEFSNSWEDGDGPKNENSPQGIATAVLQTPMPTAIFMEGSKDVHVGPRLHYNAPVTINQFVKVLKPEPVSEEELAKKAVESPLNGVKPEANGVRFTQFNYTPTADVIFSKNQEKPIKFWSNKEWYFISFGAITLALITITIVVVYTAGNNMTALKDNSSGTVRKDFSTTAPKDDLSLVTRNGDSSIFLRPGNVPVGDPPPDEPIDEDLMLPNGKRIFTKEEWGGHPPKYARNLTHPTPYVVISHTDTDMCYVSNICASELRSIQDYHVAEYDMPDIGHNFLVDGDGNVYEGRGWDATNMHDGFVKRINLAVGLIGHFLYDQPTVVQIQSTQLLLEKGVKMGKLDPDYKLFSHNWTMPTASPGPNVYRIISTWSHFTIPDANLMNSNG